MSTDFRSEEFQRSPKTNQSPQHIQVLEQISIFHFVPMKHWSFFRVCDRLWRKSSLMSVNSYKNNCIFFGNIWEFKIWITIIPSILPRHQALVSLIWQVSQPFAICFLFSVFLNYHTKTWKEFKIFDSRKH